MRRIFYFIFILRFVLALAVGTVVKALQRDPEFMNSIIVGASRKRKYIAKDWHRRIELRHNLLWGISMSIELGAS